MPLSASNAGAISSVRRISNVATSRPSVRAAAWTSPISSAALAIPTLAKIANRRRPGTTSCNSSTRLPAASVNWFDRPVMLPPGRARLSTTPMPTGSATAANTIGMADVPCFAARIFAVACVTMTSTLSRTNSAMISGERSKRVSAQRYSIATLRPSTQPSSRRRCTNAAVHRLWTEGVFAPKNPMVGSFCRLLRPRRERPRAAAPPSSVMNSRRFIRSPRRRGRAESVEFRGRAPWRS